MEIVINDSEVEEILIHDIISPSKDNGTVINSQVGKRFEGHDELTKEIAAIDAIQLGPSNAKSIHGIIESSLSKYSNGMDVKEETRNDILAFKHNIADKAIAKLMDTLDLFNPSGIEKQVDIARAASQMAGIVERVSGMNRSNGNNVHLHLHAPNQKKLESYEVIDV